jgi:hypothetical protein
LGGSGRHLLAIVGPRWRGGRRHYVGGFNPGSRSGATPQVTPSHRLERIARGPPLLASPWVRGCHYVDYLCNPGLTTRGGVVPLQMYMGVHTNGQNSEAFLTALFAARLADPKNLSWTPQSCVPPGELLIMKKGQGNDVYYVKLWDWIWAYLRGCQPAGDSQEPSGDWL